MKILGIDPGYGRCGVAVLEKAPGARDTVLESGCISTESSAPFEERLCTVLDEIGLWTKRHEPDVCALERLYFTKNQKTAMRVAETRGAIIAVMHARGVPIYEYGPGEIKVAVTGSGRATKHQVVTMVRRITNMHKERALDDEYDAIAVALTASAVLRI